MPLGTSLQEAVLGIQESAEGVTFEVLVQPRASREKLGPVVQGRLRVAVNAPPVEGAANEAVRSLLARRLGLPRLSVRIIRGHRGRHKTVQVQGLDGRLLRAGLGLEEETRR